jgi:hypothetical protein
MKCLHSANVRLILAIGALFPAVLAAHNHEAAAENKIRDRVGVVAADYVDSDVRLSLFTTKAARPTSVFQPVLTVSPGYATNPALVPDGAGAYFVGSALASVSNGAISSRTRPCPWDTRSAVFSSRPRPTKTTRSIRWFLSPTSKSSLAAPR